jgi:hypothetical protein
VLETSKAPYSLGCSIYLRAPAAGPGAQCTAYGPAYERDEQGEDARASEDRTQVLRGVVGSAGEGHAAQIIQEAQAQQGPYAREDYGDHKHQHGNQEAVLEPGAARETPRDVAADDEGQEKREQQPDEARRPALGGRGTGPSNSEERANDAADDAA